MSCGMCLANCPFGAIADKAQIFQCIQAIRSDVPVYAAIAPAIAGQFGKDLGPEKMRAAFKALGFAEVVEVAIGADLCTLQEAEDFVKEVPEKIPFMGTSCCPAWSVMAKREFPQYAECISMALTPMVLTGRLIKKEHPECKVAFIGPCAAKKLEASRRSIRSDVDFVLTFEEVLGMFEAKGVDFASLEAMPVPNSASADGRGFAVSGGRAEGLNDCRKMLLLAKAGKRNGYLLEGMACPGGCVGGAGTVELITQAANEVSKIKRNSKKAHAYESEYETVLPELE